MMDPMVDDIALIAWLDGELDESEAARMAQRVSVEPDLSARAEAHRRMRARFAAAFDPIAAAPAAELPARRAAPVMSLAAAREKRAAKAPPPNRRWLWPGALAACLVAGVMIGYGVRAPVGVADQSGALTLATPIARALDGVLSGETGPVRVALSFRNRTGEYCRSFTATHLAGVACRDGAGWALRYAAPELPQQPGAYRMAGSNAGSAQVVAAMIDGEPLGAAAELAARARGWR